MPFPLTHLIIPGLIWPDAGLAKTLATAFSERPLTGLARLLAQATRQDRPAQTCEHVLAQQFHLAPEGAPFAAFMHATRDTDTLWVCATPAHLRFANQHLLVQLLNDVTPSELDALCADLNPLMADIGSFHTHAGELLLALLPEHADKLAVRLAPRSQIDARALAHFQAEGPAAAWWQRLSSELQVLCHNHSLNTSREANGHATLNHLHLWGLGCYTPCTAPANTLYSDSLLVQSCIANSAGEGCDNPLSAAWAWCEALQGAAQMRDLNAWLNTLSGLDDTLFTPLAEHLSKRQQNLTLTSPSDTTLATFTLSKPAKWAFWRPQHASPAQLAQHLSHSISAP